MPDKLRSSFHRIQRRFFWPDTWLWDTDCHGFDGLTHSRSIRDIRVPKDTKDFMIAATLL